MNVIDVLGKEFSFQAIQSFPEICWNSYIDLIDAYHWTRLSE